MTSKIAYFWRPIQHPKGVDE